VRTYLREFLMDERVLDSPWLIRKFVVECLILPKRPKESAEAYHSIWWDEGSPLIVISRRVEELLRERIENPVALGMRYGEPTTERAIRELVDRGGPAMEEILIIPLYPHYAMSSFETAVVAAKDVLKAMGSRHRVSVLPPFYRDPLYIRAMAANARPFLDGPYDHVLFSYHGIPERHVRKTDPTGAHCLTAPDCCRTPSPAHETCYRAQTVMTTEAFAAEAGLQKGKYSISYQSRLGRDPWLKPYTDLEFVRLAEEGVRKLVVLSPAFVSDCLETLEELGMRGKDDFLKAGGEEFRLVPCLNEHPAWIDALAAWCGGPVAAFDAHGRL
jgi:ferrochelatase